MRGVLAEVRQFASDPNGLKMKKEKESLERSKRSTEAHKRLKTSTASSPESDVSSQASSEAIEDLLESPKYQPQGAFPMTTDPFGMGNHSDPFPEVAGAMEKSPVSLVGSFTTVGHRSPQSLAMEIRNRRMRRPSPHPHPMPVSPQRNNSTWWRPPTPWCPTPCHVV